MTRPRIIDPRAVPVAGTDAHLPALNLQGLDVHSLRRRFDDLASRPWAPEFEGDGRWLSDREPAAAAVLVGLVQRPEGWQVLLTRRTEHLRDHAGQISFPGGRSESVDRDAAATALREAEEEVGLHPSQVEVIGALPVYTTVTRFVVSPVVAVVRAPLALKLDSFEVAEAFEVPLQFLMTPAHHHRHVFRAEGVERQFLSMPWQGVGPDGQTRGYFIWGATAAMLRNLYRFLSA
jgi:8-oxo-dGTP pyrophosphatase MutT (NUDIX family)